MIKSVYILGCFGFIGNYVTKACLDKGWRVFGIDKETYCSYKDIEIISHSNFKYLKQDIVDIKSFHDCDYIINLAAESFVGSSLVDSSLFVHSNINGVYSILEAIRKSSVEGTKKPILIHFSTDEVYSDILTGSHIEGDVLKPSNPYSATKAAADMLIFAWARSYGISYNIVRPTNNYGEYQYCEKLIPKTVKYLSLGKKIPLHNKGTPRRTWLHAFDTAQAVISIIESGSINNIYNVSGNYEDSNLNIVCKIIKSFYGVDVDYNDYLDLTYSRPGQDLRYSINDQKLRSLGWSNEKNFDEELPSLVNFYKKNIKW